MPAARYWRAVGLQAVGGGALELSALHLHLGAARVDAAATLTSTVAPASGALAALQDEDTASAVRWLDVSAPGFALAWDFGAAQDVNALRLGAGALESEFLQALALQHSSDGAAWTTLTSVPAFAWPGAGVMQPVPGDGDEHFDKVSLLLHFDGADGSTTFTDSSSTPKALTAYSGAAISAAQSKWGGASLWLDGTNDCLSAPAHADFDFGTGDFTLEAWVFPATISGFAAIICRQQNVGAEGLFQLRLNSGKPELVFCANSSGSVVTLAAAQSIAANAWAHIAFSRQGGTGRLFVDGVLADTKSTAGTLNVAGRPLTVGVLNEGNSTNLAAFFSGHIDDVRITKGAARYTADFIPPTAPFQDSAGGGVAPAPAPRGIAQAPAIVLSGGASAPAGPVLAPAAITQDLQDCGGYCIYGTTELDADPTDVPVRRRVQLYNQRDGRLVRETWSDAATGSYRFDHIRGGDGTRYFAVAFDHTGDKRAVVADNLLPEVMT